MTDNIFYNINMQVESKGKISFKAIMGAATNLCTNGFKKKFGIHFSNLHYEKTKYMITMYGSGDN